MFWKLGCIFRSLTLYVLVFHHSCPNCLNYMPNIIIWYKNVEQQQLLCMHISNSWKSSLNSLSSAAFEDLLWVAQQKRIWTFWKFRTRNEPLLKLSLQNKSHILSTLIFNTFLNCGSLSPFFMEYLCRNPLRICVQILFKFVWSHQSYRQSNCQLSTSE